MDPSLESTETISLTAGNREHCAYCDAPLPAESAAPDSSTRYCCYGCRVLGEAGQKPLASPESGVSPWFKIAVGALLAGQSMLLGLAVNLTPPAGAVRWILHAALIFSSLASLAILGRPLCQSAMETMRERRMSIELLFLAGISGALGASFYSTFHGAGSIYYEVVAVLVTVYSVGKTLGAQSRARALAETRHLQHRFASCHMVAPDDSASLVRVVEIRPGDIVKVLPGEPIPIDGRIIRGQAFVCETPLTGEPFPVVRRVGDEVFAGSYSEDGELRIAATTPGTQRRLDALLSVLESAREHPCRMQAQADAIVRWFLPLVFLTSAATFFFWTWQSGLAAGCFNALAVLLIACPCAMGLATPIALWSGLAALAARGLVVRSADSIERLGLLDHMAFDKTGTLSQESFSLIDLATLGSPQERQVILAQLQAVQQASPHPVARAFHSLGSAPNDPPFATPRSPDWQSAVSPIGNRQEADLVSGTGGTRTERFHVRSVKSVPALGVEAWIESAQATEHHLRVGQRKLMTDLTGEPALLASLKNHQSHHLVYVELDGRLAAIAAVRERLRDSADDALRQLQALGIECTVMTGDRAENAAQLLGRGAVQSGLTSQDKLDRIDGLVEAGREVGFVGDGVNDAPAMRAASWSVALSHGAGVTTAGADAVLYGGDLRVLPWAVLLSRQVRRSVRSNLLFACAYNLIGMALAAAGLLHPIAAALLMVVSSFTVSWRALRSTEHVDGCCAVAAIPVNPQSPTEASQSSTPKARRWAQTINGILLAAQAPFLIYFGQLTPTAALLIILVFLGLGLLVMRFKTTNPETARVAHMTIAMLGIGNWGMLLGWWADSGFSQSIGMCACCLTKGFSLSHLAQAPWMNAGMLLFGLPGMLSGPVKNRSGLGRVSLGILASAGMLLGMTYGNDVLMHRLSPFIAQPVLLSFICMTIGMLLGMFLCCELGRALSLALSRRKS